jgi:hypothetical protein
MHTCASLVGARGSHCPPESFSLMAAMENCEHASARGKVRNRAIRTGRWRYARAGGERVELTMAGGAAEDTARGSPARRDPPATGGRRRERVRFQSLRVYHWILPVAGFWVRVGVRSACRVTTSPTWTQTRDGHRPCPRGGPGVFFS